MHVVTLKQIAKETGLSVPTVGNVLGRAAHRYKAETRERVLRTAKKMGYRPNASAKAVRSGRFGCVAFLLSSDRAHSHLPDQLFLEVDKQLRSRDMNLLASHLPFEVLGRDRQQLGKGQESDARRVPKVLREMTADGLLINYTHEIPQEMLDLIGAHAAPAVWLNAKLGADCVYPDDLRAGHLVGERLVRLGHRRVAYVHLPMPMPQDGWSFADYLASRHYSVHDRVAGVTEAVRAAGGTVRVLGHDRLYERDEHRVVARALLAAPASERPTAVVAYGPAEATTVLFAAEGLGMSVPRDVSVVMFAPEAVRVAGTLVATAVIPVVELGRVAVRMLIDKLSDGPTPAPPAPAAVIRFTLVEGQTLGAAPGGA